MSRDIQEGREQNGNLDVLHHFVLRHRLGVGRLFASKLRLEIQARSMRVLKRVEKFHQFPLYPEC